MKIKMKMKMKIIRSLLKIKMNIHHKEGNILDAEEDYICHQCNCVTRRGKGLSEQIFNKFPYADVYSKRKSPSVPGTIEVRNNIIAMYAQYFPGKAKYESDGKYERILWFILCLEQIIKLNPKSIALPYGIGCGLAGGKWSEYYEIIERMAHKYPSIKIVIYKLQ